MSSDKTAHDVAEEARREAIGNVMANASTFTDDDERAEMEYFIDRAIAAAKVEVANDLVGMNYETGCRYRDDLMRDLAKLEGR